MTSLKRIPNDKLDVFLPLKTCLFVAISLLTRYSIETVFEKDNINNHCTEFPKIQWNDPTKIEFKETNSSRLFCEEELFPRYWCDPLRLRSYTLVGCEDFQGDRFSKLLENKTISFVGDSLNRQMYRNLLCQLSRVGQIEKFIIPSDKNGYREVTLKSNGILKNQWVMAHYVGSRIDHRLFDADIMVFNIGAFVNSRIHMEFLLQQWKIDVFDKFRGEVIGREYSPCHFPDTDGGDVKLGFDQKSFGCQKYSLKDFLQSKFAFRLTTFNDFFDTNNFTILRVFNISMGAFEQHANEKQDNDCRHWCNPSPMLTAWNELLYNLLIEKQFDLF